MVIFIGGSWGVGEWKFNKLSGPGIAQFCHEQTINLCRSSLSADEQLAELTTLLIKYKHDDQDKFYWLVHNPLVGIPSCDIYHKQDTLEQGIRIQLTNQLTKANNLAREHNLLLHLIGASCDLDTVSISQYSNLKLAVPSWGRILIKNYPSSIFSHQADHLLELKNEITIHRPELVAEYHKIGAAAFSKRRAMLNHEELFHSFHPTTLGHITLNGYLNTI